MKKIYTKIKKVSIALAFSITFFSTHSNAQLICGPIVENFEIGTGTAGFIGDFTYGTETSGSTTRKFLERRRPQAGVIYSLSTPTYKLANNQNSVGYGFVLDGTEQIANVRAFITYVSSINGEIVTVLLANFVPIYNTNPTTGRLEADVCRAVSLTELNGFSTGGSYRLRFEFTPNTGNGNSNNQNITFDDFRTNGTIAFAPLPVHFISLVAKKLNSGVQLVWKVAGEENVNRYEVERSLDGRVFNTIGTVAAGQKDTYTYTDGTNNNTIYYRIKNVDNDGKFKYSSVAKLENGRMKIVLKAFPQPVLSSLTIQHPETKGNGLINVSTVEGRVVKTIKVSGGTNQTYVEMNNLQKGIYIVRFDDGEGAIETMKIVKQ